MNILKANRMHSCKSRALLIIMIILTLSSTAQTLPYVYTYTGNTFSSVYGEGFPGITPYDHLTITFTMDSDMLAEYASTGMYIDSTPYTISVGGKSFYFPQNEFEPIEYFFLITHLTSLGVPDAWCFQVDGEYYGYFPEYITSYSDNFFGNGHTPGGDTVEDFTSTGPSSLHATPGVWSATAVPAPEPSTSILLCVGLASFYLLRRRGKSKV